MTPLALRIGAAAVALALLFASVLYIQHITGENARLTLERDAALASEADALKSLSALQRAAQERIADNTRIDTAEKGLRDDLDRIEKALPKDAPRPAPDAASVAVTCSRLLRSGQTRSPEYRRFCGGSGGAQ